MDKSKNSNKKDLLKKHNQGTSQLIRRLKLSEDLQLKCETFSSSRDLEISFSHILLQLQVSFEDRIISSDFSHCFYYR